MKVFKTRSFLKWANKHKLSSKQLSDAISEIRQGLIEANYGGGLYKKRIATKGRGKRASTRVLLAYKKASIAVFLYGFEKNERNNITVQEEKAYKLLTSALLKFNSNDINTRIKEGSLIEVTYDQK